jgi:hypothetical protein
MIAMLFALRFSNCGYCVTSLNLRQGKTRKRQRL